MTAAPPREALWRAARRVLLVRLDNLGDVLMTTPAFAAVRESLPGAHVALLAAPSSGMLAPHLPMIDEFIGFHAPWVKAGAAALEAGGGGRGAAERELLERLQAGRFDAAIVFTVCTQSPLPAALLCRMAGIPLVLAHERERAYGLLSDAVADRDEIGPGLRHEVRRQLDLVGRVGLRTADERLRFELREEDAEAARAALRLAGVDTTRPYVLVHPGASAASRRYPAPAFGAAASLIQAEGCRVVFCAGPDEAGLLQEAREAMGGAACVLPPPAGLGTLAGLIVGARVLVANNSGPVHLAAALGTPVVDLYALTNPQHKPWRVAARVLSHDVPCRNCLQSVCSQGHHDCLRRVEPRQVADAALDLLREAA